VSVRVIIKPHIAIEVEWVLRVARKVARLGGLELYQWRPEANKCVLRIFTNSTDNALKYGEESLTRISIGYEDSESLQIFSVADNGKGLKEGD